MSSAAEAELAALFINAREAVYIRQVLEQLGHKQPPTPVQTDNSTAEAVLNNKLVPKMLKAMDMRFHWLRDRSVNQEQFCFFWSSGRKMLADYPSKHHPGSHHRSVRPEFLTPQKVLDDLRARLAQNRGGVPAQ